MSTFDDIARSRRLIRIGSFLGFAAAAVLTALRIANTDPATAGEVLGSLALGAAAATPSTLALLALDRRPSLLPAATIALIPVGILTSVLLPVFVIIGLVWYRAWRARVVHAGVSRSWAAARVGLAALVAASILSLFAHVDPVCTQTLTDGTTRSVDPATRGLDTGWAISIGTTAVASYAVGTEVAEERCSSDSIVVPEALVSLVIVAATIELARRWPRGAIRSRDTANGEVLADRRRGGA